VPRAAAVLDRELQRRPGRHGVEANRSEDRCAKD